jgi:proteasome lid subunit RPN8/RPN11
VRAVVQHARAALPRECCGLLVGRSGHIMAALPIPNVAAGDEAFEIDGLTCMQTERLIRRAGLELLGYYHSHPHGRPVASREDHSGALWAELPPRLRLIVTPRGLWTLYFTTAAGWVALAAGSPRPVRRLAVAPPTVRRADMIQPGKGPGSGPHAAPPAF